MVSRLDLSKVDLPALPAYTLFPGHPSPGKPTLLRPPIVQWKIVVREY